MLQIPDDELTNRYFDYLFKVLLAASAFTFSVYYLLKLLREKSIKSWPRAVGTIQSASMEYASNARGDWYYLPCFAFSYMVTDKDYSGSFMLFADVEKGELLVSRLIGCPIEVKYNPKLTTAWYIPAKRIEDCEVVQKMGPNVKNLDLPND